MLAHNVSLAVANAQTNLVEQLTSVFSGGALSPDVLQDCADNAVSSTLFQDVLNTSLAATRKCFSLDLTRANLDACIVKSSDAARLATSPYDIFSVHALTPADIAALATCAAGVDQLFDDAGQSVHTLCVRRKRGRRKVGAGLGAAAAAALAPIAVA